MAGGSIGGGVAAVTFSSDDNLVVATNAANTILNGINSGALTPVTYSGSGSFLAEPPSGSNGVAIINTPTTQAVLVTGGDPYVVVNANGPVSVWGGAAGGTFLGGAGAAGAARNVTYTNITPSGNATSTILITGGNNLVQTTVAGAGGNYNVATGSGNDTVNILVGNSTINAGTGFNQINVGSGNNLITSVGADLITGSSVGGGSDTVNVTSGNTTINAGTSNFLVNDSSPNPLLVKLGFGIDTVNVGGGSAVTVQGLATTTTTKGATVTGTDTSTGDSISVSGGASTVTAAGANDTLQAFTGNNLLVAGTGNDTLIAGSGADTLSGAIGGNATALLVSGSGLGTTFSFVAGHSSGLNTIVGLKSTDIISFTGYGSQPNIASTTFGASTVLALSDGTKVTIQGVTPAATQFVIK